MRLFRQISFEETPVRIKYNLNRQKNMGAVVEVHPRV